MDTNIIYNIDCVAGMNQMIDEESIDLIIADPPYFKVIGEKWDYLWRTEEDYLEWSEKITNDGNIITDVFPSKNNTYSDVLLPLSSYSGSTTISVANIKNVIKKYSPSARVNGLNKEKLLQLLEDIRKTNNITNADLCNKFADEIYLPKIVLKKADIPLSLRSQFIDLR